MKTLNWNDLAVSDEITFLSDEEVEAISGGRWITRPYENWSNGNGARFAAARQKRYWVRDNY